VDGATESVGGKRSGASGKRGSESWTALHTVALISLIVLIFLIGLIPPNRIIPGFAAPAHGLVVWLILMVLLGFCFVVIGKGTTGVWEGLLIDTRNKMSLSRLQLILWTLVVLSAFLTVALFNIRNTQMADPLHIKVPSQVWGLLGNSTVSFVTAATIKSQKKNLSVSDEVTQRTTEALRKVGDDPKKLADPQGALVAYERPRDAGVSDLFKGDEVVAAAYLDLGKVQVFFFTLIIVFAYAAEIGALLYGAPHPIKALPDLSTGIVALLGISHAGYLTSKAVPSNPADYDRG
jgi:hypothetical protein